MSVSGEPQEFGQETYVFERQKQALKKKTVSISSNPRGPKKGLT
jgi:hypothetical protein